MNSGEPIGYDLTIDFAAVWRPMFDEAVAYFLREMVAGTFRRHDREQLLLTGYGALVSYLSDAPFLEGSLDIDPLDPRALAHVATTSSPSSVPPSCCRERLISPTSGY